MVGLGQCCVDQVALLHRFPDFGAKEPLREVRTLPGGQIATALLAARRLGLRTALIGSVGDDEAAGMALAPLRDAGVDLEGVRVRNGSSTHLSLILVDSKSAERTVLWYRDARLPLKPDELRRSEIERGRALHLDACDLEASTWAAQVAQEAGIPVVLDADTAAPGIEALLARVDFPIVSRQFAEEQFETRSIREALVQLARGARMAVVTLGSHGVLAREGDREIPSPAFEVTPRDTTGCGDVFHAAFVWGLLEGLPAERVLRAANAAAALSCRALGAQGALPNRDELVSFLAREEPGPWRDPDSQRD